jgi:hypothetical protein
MDIYHHYKEVLKIRSNYAYERPTIKSTDIIKDNKIVERELIRQQLYTEILQLLKILMGPHIKTQKIRDKWGDKELNHLLLRYLFNKIIGRTDNDDPIFIYNPSKIVEEQLINDFKFAGINYDPIQLMNYIDKKFKDAYDTLQNSNIPDDDIPTMVSNKILYKGVEYNDISKLGENNPEYLGYALALNIRYNYIHLESHGLARQYELMGFTPDDACEGFASAFNHYFNSYCSAFPDLERPFGSIGSFFNQSLDNWNKYIVFVNPPFDQILMDIVLNRVTEFLNESNNRRTQSTEDTTNKLMPYDHHYILTMPNWTDWKGLYNFKMNIETYMTVIYLKGSLPFINHMDNDDKPIYPSDIVELFCKNQLK